jgi:predicted ATPase/class 3 adenylate cyclase
MGGSGDAGRPVAPAGDVEVALLFTDIEASTPKWEADPDAMRAALAVHDTLLAKVIAARGGTILKHTGDVVVGRFEQATDAALAALDAQDALAAADFAAVGGLRVRMGLHVGSAEERDGDLFGPALNRAARVMQAANGAQVLATSPVREALTRDVAPSVEVTDLGLHRLRGLAVAERLYQVARLGAAAAQPPRSLNASVGNLPADLPELIGRQGLLGEVCAEALRPGVATVLGPAGVGKTLLALHAGRVLAPRFADGVWVVDLVAVENPDEVPAALARVVGLATRAGQELTDTLAEAFAVRELLVVLDNAEHVRTSCAHLVAALTRRGSPARVLTTSQVPLGVPGERVVRVGPLPVDADPALGADRAGELPAAVALLLRRCGWLDVTGATTVDEDDLRAARSICEHLDGLPLAIELAAARAELLTLEQIEAGLDRRLALLRRGAVADRRHASLVAAFDWTVQLLRPGAQDLLSVLGVLGPSFDLSWLAAVAGPALGTRPDPGSRVGADELEVLGLLSELVDHCLVAPERVRGGVR